jgi:hypothetical protein
MRVTVNDKEIIFPSSLSEFTLGQRIAFQEAHGNLLDKMLTSIMEMDNEILQRIELTQFTTEKMFRMFAFFAGISVDDLKESAFVEDVARIYNSCMSLLFEEEDKLENAETFIWNKEEWTLHPVELKHGSKMKFGELIDSNQIVKDMAELGSGKWGFMLPLCAIFLRKKDEEFSKEFLYEGSERLELMKSLPMDIALQVGFFLRDTLNTYIHISIFSEQQEPRNLENISEHIMIDTAG